MKATKLLLTVIALFLTVGAKATHMAGADLTYQSLGNGQYLVTYTFYRDCIGIPAQASHSLDISSVSCGYSFTETLLPVPGTGQQINYTCPGAVTTCDGGPDPGIQEWEYTVVVNIPDSCADWTFGVAACCRNAAITTIQSPTGFDMYVEAHLNNTVSDNNSPIFSNVPIGFECHNQNNYYNHGGLDVDGDSLVYSFITPRDAPNTPLTYNSPYSLTNPLTSTGGVTINNVTGDIFMHPTVANEVSVIAVLIQEYRNGVLIGSVIRDIQIYVLQCNNQLPTATGINGTNVFTLNTCIGGPICFDVFTNDPDVGDIITALHNNGIPAATFTIDSSGTFPIIHFCWSPQPSDVRPQPYIFTITVKDDACPSNGVQSYGYAIYLGALQATVASSNISCNGGHNGQIQITASDPNAQFMTMPGMFSNPNLSHLSAGNYTINVSNGTGCTGIYYVQITQPAPLAVTVTPTNATCSGTPAGASAFVTGGTLPYQYTWNTTPPSAGSTITGVDSGHYTVVIRDSNNCMITGQVYIALTSSFTASMTATPASCNTHDGTASVQTVGGGGPFSYVWLPNVSSSSSATGLAAGVYNVTVTDQSSGCVQNVSATVGSNSGVLATVTSVIDATCQSGEDGSATVVASGGQPPYDYLWMPGGQTTATATNLAPGAYSVVVADYNGCPTYLTVNIGFTFPAPIVSMGPDTMPCIGTPFTMDAGACLGCTYLWDDNSTNQTRTVMTSGIYTVLVTDANGCEGTDVVNVTFITCFGSESSSMGTTTFFSIVPNPANDEIELMTKGFDKKELNVRIINVQGKVVLLKNILVSRSSKEKIDISTLPAGVYTIQLLTGETMHAAKLVKL